MKGFVLFKNREHEKFYNTYLSKCRYQDSYHKALVYCHKKIPPPFQP
ncbi:MAG: DUF6075 family protein [Lachnospiraceae bacterium]